MYNIHNLKRVRNTRKMLRRNMTPTERKLWLYLRGKKFKGYRFRRQHSIGNYIVDFYCPKLRLVIELDGSQHIQQSQADYDQRRTNYLNTLNIKVLRYSNYDVEYNIDGVIEDIEEQTRTNNLQ